MKKISWITGAIVALLGLLIVIFPVFWLKVVVILLGLGSIAYGIYNIKITKGLFENSYYEKTILIKSILSIIVGILAVVLPATIAGAMWTVMVYILAVYLVLSAVLGFYSVSLLKDSGVERNRFVLENLGLLVGAVFLFIVPSKSLGTFVIRLLGILVAVLGIIILVIDLADKKNTLEADVEEGENESKIEAVVRKIKTRSKKSKSATPEKNSDPDATIVAEAIVTQEVAEDVETDTDTSE